MQKKRVVIMDSGVGGLHILRECERVLPGVEFVYIADKKNAPYGIKSKHQLCQIAENLVEFAVRTFNPCAVVFACNTLTVNTIKFVREKFKNLLFVGVEPAIKKAIIYGGKTVVLSTSATHKQFKKLERKIVKNLKREYLLQGLRYAGCDEMVPVAMPNLAQEIEQNLENLDVILPKLLEFFAEKKFENVQNLVLGCTHYMAIKKQLGTCFPNAQIFDGSVAVAGRLKSVLKIKNNPEKNISKIIFLSTDKCLENEKKLKKYYNLIKNN